MKTSTKNVMAIEAILAAAAAIVMCLTEIYIDQHPIRALIHGFSANDMWPIVIGGFVAASVLVVTVTKTISAIKAAVEKRKAKKAAK